jgi:hypothetical protein
LASNFGGEIVVLDEINKVYGKKNPDFEWNDKLWEVKKPKQLKRFGRNMNDGVKQIEQRPGGIVMDMSDLKIDDGQIRQFVTSIIRNTIEIPIIVKLKNGHIIFKRK